MVTVAQKDLATVTLAITPCSDKYVTGIRYLWRESPCPYKQAAVYSIENDLPSGPFIYRGYIGYHSANAINARGQKRIALNKV